MADLEQRLRDLGGEPAAWPPTPDLTAAVMARLPSAAPPRRRGLAAGLGRRVLLGLVALVLAAPAAALAFPGARDDVLRALGLRHVTVEEVPAPPPGAVDPRLGPRTTVAAAARRATFAPVVPAALGPPDRVHQRGDVITLVYARRGLLLAQAPGRLDPNLLTKIVSIAAGIHRTRVAGRPAVFFPRRHFYLWLDRTGSVRQSEPVRSGPSLVWERDGVVLRLEGERRQDEAVRIATSVR
jgi:hypothetical protein